MFPSLYAGCRLSLSIIGALPPSCFRSPMLPLLPPISTLPLTNRLPQGIPRLQSTFLPMLTRSFGRRAISNSAACFLHIGNTRINIDGKYKTVIHHSSERILPLERPPDPSSLSSPSSPSRSESNELKKLSELSYPQQQARILREWMRNKQSILVLTGAGMSTESGIPDYRGNKGSYFQGHKPIIHHEFMSSETTRKRYWARSLLGYSPFANAKPNLGHEALAYLEEGGYIGVHLDESNGLDCSNDFKNLAGVERVNEVNGMAKMANIDTDLDPRIVSSWESPLIHYGAGTKRKISTITQNVDILHSKAGSKHVLHLHGRGDVIRCMHCGSLRDRKDYHGVLWERNRDWIEKSTGATPTVPCAPGTADENDGKNEKKAELRPDGDAEWNGGSYDNMILPSCTTCDDDDQMDSDNNQLQTSHQTTLQQKEKQSFYKTDVVFFGDSIPKHRVHLSNSAVDNADGLLCIGTSLAVHSAFRLAKRAIGNGVQVAVLNVGVTRLEREYGLDGKKGGDADECASLITKIESPIGETLAELVKILESEAVTEGLPL